MSSTDPLNYRPSIGDRIGILFFMALGLALVIWSAIGSAMYITDVVRGAPIEATVSLVHTSIDVPLGAAGHTIPMKLDTASVTADHLTGAAAGTAVVSAILGFVVITAIVICLSLLARNSLRGKIFSRGNTRLLVGAGMTALAGFGLTSIFDRMVGNEILLSLGNGSLDNIAIMTANPLPYVLLAFAFGIVATAYTIGARMQRETEGLI